MSSATLIPSVFDINKSEAPQFYISATISYVFAVAAVALRFWARKLMKARIWVDDWVVALALLIATGLFISATVWLSRGNDDFGQEFTTTFGRNLFIEELLYTFVIGLARISILAFYWRIFGASIRFPCYVLGAITICWMIANTLGTVFQCVPVSGFWDRKIPAKCTNLEHFFIASGVLQILTDVALLLLPMPYVWRLHMTTSQKVALSGTFLLGGFVSMISAIRLAIILERGLNWRSWSLGQSNMAIVAACLPSLRPVLSLILHGEPNPSLRDTRRKSFSRAWTRSHSSAAVQSRGQRTTASESQHTFVPLPDEALGFSATEQVHGIAVTSSGDRNAHQHEDIEMQEGDRRAKVDIQVRSDVIVQSTQSK